MRSSAGGAPLIDFSTVAPLEGFGIAFKVTLQKNPHMMETTSSQKQFSSSHPFLVYSKVGCQYMLYVPSVPLTWRCNEPICPQGTWNIHLMCSNGVLQTPQRDGGAAAEATSSGTAAAAAAATITMVAVGTFCQFIPRQKNSSPARIFSGMHQR